MSVVLALEFVGALGILVPFALFQLNKTSQHSQLYLWLNLFGSGLLTVVGWLHHQWGFVILQGVWTLVTAWSIGKRLHGRASERPAE